MNAVTKTLDQQFADLFTNLAAGLDHLPENLAAAVQPTMTTTRIDRGQSPSRC